MDKEKKIIVVMLGILAILMSVFLIRKQGNISIKNVNENNCIETAGNKIITSNNEKIDNQKLLPVYCVSTEKPQIAISFDAAWGNEDTERILEILEEENIKATFFMTGSWVEAFPEDVKEIYAAGHELGNHSLHHYDMTTISKQEMQEEVMAVHNMVKELTGCDMQVFRPPYGAYNDNVIEAVRGCGYQAIQWDVDSLDWKNYGVDSIINTVCNHKNLGNGSIILCHNGGKYTADALQELIRNLKASGYEFVRISELVDVNNYNMDFEGRQQPEASN